MKILVVDDDSDLRTLVAFALRQAGYLVVEAGDGPSALATFERESPALVVLDVNLPRLDGFEVCRRIRALGSTPVLLLTVRNTEEDLVRGLDLGADDFLTKPFSPRTLLARLRALLRRAGVERPAPLLAGHFALDVEMQTVSLAGGPALRLTHLEFRLLQLLLANAGQVLPSERLLRHVWGERASGDRQLLKQLVHRLRQKIEVDAAAPRYLVTASGLGYALRPEGEAREGE
ncbi:MAG: response regulator transcription factor [Thermoanaerobaculia bacterium]|nr:response regulator transcription factor [Thermoanaerobaculia bacterium]